jgi:multidrug efflux pump subunit AcrB
MFDMSDIVKDVLMFLALAMIPLMIAVFFKKNQKRNFALAFTIVSVGIGGFSTVISTIHEQALEWLANWLVPGAILLFVAIVLVFGGGLVFWLSNRNNRIEI